MRVFVWEMTDEGVRRVAIRPTDDAGVRPERLPREPSNIERVLDTVIDRAVGSESPCALSVGIGGTPSPRVGTHHDDLIELFRVEAEGRIHVTYAKERWPQVHFLGRLPTLGVAKGVRARLIAHGRERVQGHPCTIDSAGDEGVCDGEVVLFALVGIGPLFAPEAAS